MSPQYDTTNIVNIHEIDFIIKILKTCLLCFIFGVSMSTDYCRTGEVDEAHGFPMGIGLRCSSYPGYSCCVELIQL